MTVEFYDYNKKLIPSDAPDDTLVGYWLIPDWYAKVVIDYMSSVESAAQVLNEYYSNATEYEGVKQPP